MIAMARTALMESGIMFFISLTIYSFLIFLENKKYWWFFGISLGLMLETKFTTFFVIPVILIYLWFSNRQVLKQKQFYSALGIAFIIFLPVILYNLFMYEDHGHFAIQLVRLLHQNSPWVMSGVAPFTLSNAVNTLVAFGLYISFPYLFITTISAVYLLFTARRYSLLPIMGFFWATIEDILIGTRGLQSMFIAPVVAIALIHLQKHTLPPLYKIIIKIFTVVFLLYLFIFTLQSNQTINPAGKEGWSHDNLGRRNYGGKQLNDYLDNLEKTVPDLSRYDQYASLKIRKPSLYKYLNDGPNELNGRTQELKKIIIFDQNILWFSQLWLFARRGFYTDLAIFSTKEMNLNAKTYLSPDTIYLIVATENAALDPTIVRTDTAKFFEDPLIANGVAPTHIYRDDGKIAFNVYKIDRPEIIRTYGFNK